MVLSSADDSDAALSSSSSPSFSLSALPLELLPELPSVGFPQLRPPPPPFETSLPRPVPLLLSWVLRSLLSPPFPLPLPPPALALVEDEFFMRPACSDFLLLDPDLDEEEDFLRE